MKTVIAKLCEQSTLSAIILAAILLSIASYRWSWDLGVLADAVDSLTKLLTAVAGLAVAAKVILPDPPK
jgi:hypothetical protein